MQEPFDHHPSVYKAFTAQVDKTPEHIAVSYLGEDFDYLRLKTLADGFAAGLHRIGIGQGERVLIYLPNSVSWVIAWLACQRLGAVAVPVTPIYTPYDLEYIARDTQATVICCLDTNYGYVRQVKPNSMIKNVIVCNLTDFLPIHKRIFGFLFDVVPKGRFDRAEGVYSMTRLILDKEVQALYEPEIADADPLEILYTGGTIKRPKGVPINQRLFLVSASEQANSCAPLFRPSENRIMANAPLYHILGQTLCLSSVLCGGTLLLQPRINLDAVFATIERYKARTLVGVPTMYRMILEHDRLDQYDLNSLRYCFSGGDVLPVEVRRRWFDRFGVQIYQGYGATETCGGTSMCPVDAENPEKSVGRIVASKKVKLVNAKSLKEVELGQPGELLVSSDAMVKSYLNQPEETQKSFVTLEGHLWYRTQDIMSMDEDGNLYFVDRNVDTIKHKGYRVSSSEVEAVLQEHPSVVSSCVIGIPDEKVGERIKAFVVLKEGVKGITGYDLIRWSKDKLVHYKVPHYIEFRDMLPKSKVGKLLRRELRTQEKSLKIEEPEKTTETNTS